MKIKLYWKLALGNIWRNRRLYLPFLLGCTISVFCLYTFCMMSFNPGISKMRGGESLALVLGLGIFVMVLFTFFFMLYANSFLFKRRMKELGLYSVLGLDKRHVARMLLVESLVSAAVCLAVGLSMGMLLGKLMFLFVERLVGTPVPLTSGVSVPALIVCAVFFALSFLLLLLRNVLYMRLACPATLLMGSQRGEREPKSHWVLAILGLICMVSGYVMAGSVKDPLMAIVAFFFAVMLVILGTYALFIAGSIVILKSLKKVKRIYYKRKNFVTLSGMLYRMKQHAAGLATVCILSTMVIITLGTTTALYTGQKDVLKREFPYQVHMSVVDEGGSAYDTADAIRAQALADHPEVAVAEEITADIYFGNAFYQNDTFSRMSEAQRDMVSDFTAFAELTLMDQQQYERITGEQLALGDGELAVFSLISSRTVPATYEIGGRSYTVKTELNTFLRQEQVGASIYAEYAFILPDAAAAAQMYADLGGPGSTMQQRRMIQWDLSGDADACRAYSDELQTLSFQSSVAFNYQSVYILQGNWNALSGGFLFLGLFIGLMFLMATVLIIYFKQVSEGYSDHDQFIIMQKVGMDKDQVKSTVNRQILSVFLLPLLVAGVHTIGASNMMRQLLAIFGLGNTRLINLSILLTGLLFALVYMVVYLLTSRTYYKLVEWEK